jgi:aromatic ring-opening dioxygenase catalytic subunit (LigB family)
MLPVVFVSHGPGPYPLAWKRNGEHRDFVRAYETIPKRLKLDEKNVKTILVISAHFETSKTLEVTSQESHETLMYDYSGFPGWTYSVKYAPGGSPKVAERVCDVLKSKKIPCVQNFKRNLDHGVFIPLMLMFPEAKIPTLQLSIPTVTRDSEYNARVCLEIGNALRPLRKEGVLIVASGSATHGRGKPIQFSQALMRTLRDTDRSRRLEMLAKWEKTLPQARQAHGREEHLLPLHIALGAADDGKVILCDEGWWGNLFMGNFAFL